MRFAARFGMTIDEKTRAALVAMADQVRVVSVERIAQELRKMLVHSTRAKSMDLAMDVGLIRGCFPLWSGPKVCFRASRSSPRVTSGTTSC